MSRHEYFLYAIIFLLLITVQFNRYTKQVNNQKSIIELGELNKSYKELIRNSYKYGWSQGAVFGTLDAYDTISYQEQFVTDSLLFETILK